jgi:hypothetical protein
MADPVRVVLEVAPRRAFASALDWSRGARTPEQALEALVGAGPRYASVAALAGLPFDPPGDVDALEIVERLAGDGSTEFGVPGAAAAAEDAPLIGDDLDRFAGLLEASWSALDAASRAAGGVELTRGPRGGGRDLRRSSITSPRRSAPTWPSWDRERVPTRRGFARPSSTPCGAARLANRSQTPRGRESRGRRAMPSAVRPGTSSIMRGRSKTGCPRRGLIRRAVVPGGEYRTRNGRSSRPRTTDSHGSVLPPVRSSQARAKSATGRALLPAATHRPGKTAGRTAGQA